MSPSLGFQPHSVALFCMIVGKGVIFGIEKVKERKQAKRMPTYTLLRSQRPFFLVPLTTEMGYVLGFGWAPHRQVCVVQHHDWAGLRCGQEKEWERGKPLNNRDLIPPSLTFRSLLYWSSDKKDGFLLGFILHTSCIVPLLRLRVSQEWKLSHIGGEKQENY